MQNGKGDRQRMRDIRIGTQAWEKMWQDAFGKKDDMTYPKKKYWVGGDQFYGYHDLILVTDENKDHEIGTILELTDEEHGWWEDAFCAWWEHMVPLLNEKIRRAGGSGFTIQVKDD